MIVGDHLEGGIRDRIFEKAGLEGATCKEKGGQDWLRDEGSGSPLHLNDMKVWRATKSNAMILFFLVPCSCRL
ncbi:hypothetical protein CI102_7567 [Trichoderma harzianum]|nr:hypothetical protein CI102_7567 [Trichoderma harzianum]